MDHVKKFKDFLNEVEVDDLIDALEGVTLSVHGYMYTKDDKDIVLYRSDIPQMYEALRLKLKTHLVKRFWGMIKDVANRRRGGTASC